MLVRLLLDTHALARWLLNDSQLSGPARQAIAFAGNEILVSAVSAFEMATIHRVGKWPNIGPVLQQFDDMLREETFLSLTITSSHAIRAGQLSAEHRDPFDRLLAAQAIVASVGIVTNDVRLRELGAQVVW